MQKLRRTLLPGTGSQSISTSNGVGARHSVVLEPEVGFQITIESSQQPLQTLNQNATLENAAQPQKITIPELNVHLLAARHLPNLFGFKIVQGYQIKVKLFPGSKRLDSSIQTNSWPKFNENFKFPLAPDIKPSLKHSVRRSSKSAVNELFTPEELFAGQFVVFTVYALLELPPASFSRLNKTYRSLRDKSSNFVQKVVESSNGKIKDDNDNDGTSVNDNDGITNNKQKPKSKRKSNENNSRDNMPQLTIGESRRNLGSVTCYLEPKIFKRNARSGLYTTEELWLPIKDITTTARRNQINDQTYSPKGTVEIILEVRDASKLENIEDGDRAEKNRNAFYKFKQALTPPTTPTIVTGSTDMMMTRTINGDIGSTHNNHISNSNNNNNQYNINNNSNKINNSINKNGKVKYQQWNRMTAEVKRKMGLSNISKDVLQQNGLVLRVTTARMRCTQKVKDELECTAGNVYVKTAIFENGVFIDSWKSPNFYPSLANKWDINDEIATLNIPIQDFSDLGDILVRTTLATKTKMGKKLVLGTVLIGATVPTSNGNGFMHMQQLRESLVNEPLSMWHNYQ